MQVGFDKENHLLFTEHLNPERVELEVGPKIFFRERPFKAILGKVSGALLVW